MTAAAAEKLLRRLCEVPELLPEFWGLSEPIDKPFNGNTLHEAVHGLMVPFETEKKRVARTGAFFFVRKVLAALFQSTFAWAPCNGLHHTIVCC